jgi:hypothetical protein
LVEKKSPLSMPPEFDELPIPSKSEKVDKESVKEYRAPINNRKKVDEKSKISSQIKLKN